MAPPIRTARLSMEAFPECPSEFRPTLEKLLALLNEQGNAIAQAVNGNLTRGENLRGAYITATGVVGQDGILVATAKHHLPGAPKAVWAHRLQREDITDVIPGTWVLNRWRPLQDGMIEIAMRGLGAGSRYTVHLVVE